MVNGRQVQVLEIDPGTAKIHFTYRGDASPYQWIHIEIRNAKGEFIGIVNPVYAGKKESRYHTYQEMQALIITSGEK